MYYIMVTSIADFDSELYIIIIDKCDYIRKCFYDNSFKLIEYDFFNIDLDVRVSAYSNLVYSIEKIIPDNSICPICWDIVKEKANKCLQCKTIYHNDCIYECFKTRSTCPYCSGYEFRKI